MFIGRVNLNLVWGFKEACDRDILVKRIGQVKTGAKSQGNCG